MKANLLGKPTERFLLGVLCAVLISIALPKAILFMTKDKEFMTEVAIKEPPNQIPQTQDETNKTLANVLSKNSEPTNKTTSLVQTTEMIQDDEFIFDDKSLNHPTSLIPQQEILLFRPFANNRRAADIVQYLKEVTGYHYEVTEHRTFTNTKFQVKLIIPKDTSRKEVASKLEHLAGIHLESISLDES